MLCRYIIKVNFFSINSSNRVDYNVSCNKSLYFIIIFIVNIDNKIVICPNLSRPSSLVHWSIIYYIRYVFGVKYSMTVVISVTLSKLHKYIRIIILSTGSQDILTVKFESVLLVHSLLISHYLISLRSGTDIKKPTLENNLS